MALTSSARVASSACADAATSTSSGGHRKLMSTYTPPLLGHPSRRPQSVMCIIPRSIDVTANDIALEHALVVMVAGTRTELTPSDVQVYIVGHFGLSLGSFTVHPRQPKDFLVLDF
jgi:hypothetical protein